MTPHSARRVVKEYGSNTNQPIGGIMIKEAIIAANPMYTDNAVLIDAWVDNRLVTLTFEGAKAVMVPMIVKNHDVIFFDGYWAHNTYYVRNCRPDKDAFVPGRNINCYA
jgi:hypothetical protein